LFFISQYIITIGRCLRIAQSFQRLLMLFALRSDQNRITHSKEMHEALSTLYEASLYLHPINQGHFSVEDSIIQGSKSSAGASFRPGASNFLRRAGVDGDKVSHFFDDLRSDHDSHWLKPGSSYAVVERALSDPKSATMLAKRIWMSLVARGKTSLSAEDIAEVLGPYRRGEALRCFQVLDENGSSDITLEEMIWTVIECGRIRNAIYKGLHDINHCINTFDWISQLMIAAVMIFFIRKSSYLPCPHG